ncbi:unnamed protein product [Calypogeia fissa]
MALQAGTARRVVGRGFYKFVGERFESIHSDVRKGFRSSLEGVGPQLTQAMLNEEESSVGNILRASSNVAQESCLNSPKRSFSRGKGLRIGPTCWIGSPGLNGTSNSDHFGGRGQNPFVQKKLGQLELLYSGNAQSRAFSTTFTPSEKEWSTGPTQRVITDASAVTQLALDSVVKIFTMASSPNYFLPWQNKPQREITGSGFVISGRRIVTNAHVVADQTYVVVRKHGSPSKYRAKVMAVGHECDLALLEIQDEDFWDGMTALQLGDIPYLQESVAVVGYPQGGDNISVTGGVVSRVEPTQYVHGTAHLMAIQIDAAINPGNSGGPALMEDKVVGVAFQNLAGAENVGYIIPVPIINHFLEDVEEKKRYVGFCSLGLICQAIENPHLREHLQMPPGLTGVLVNKIQPLTDTFQWLKKDDVLVAFDDTPIANDGTVHFRNRERIAFDHLVSMKKAGEKGKLTILRDGSIANFDVKLDPLKFLVPIHQYDRLPSYFIFAGLVFTPLTQPYLHEYGDDWYNTAPRRLCEKALTGTLTKPEEQFVILSQVLVDEVNAGYERLADYQVQKVNGVEVQNLRHLKGLVEGCTSSSLRFDLDEGRVLVLNYETAKEASYNILRRHRIRYPSSEDLLDYEKDVDMAWY